MARTCHSPSTRTTTRPASRRRATALVLAPLTVLAPMLVPATAVAAPPTDDRPVVTTTTITDHDDADGPLDVARVSHRVRERGDRATVRYTVRLHDPVSADDLDRRHRYLVAELSTDGSSGADRNITVYARDGRLHADLISNATREVIRPLHVRLLGQRLRVRGPRHLVGARRVFWYSYFHRTGHPACGWQDGYPVTCADSVPDDGWLRLPAAAWPPSDRA
jgi:hypothetical protein